MTATTPTSPAPRPTRPPATGPGRAAEAGPADRGASSGPRTVLRLVALELRLLAREPMVAVGLVGFPLATVLVLAGVFGSTPDPDFAGVVPSDHYLAGYVGVVLAALGLLTIPVHLASERESGVRRRLRASGVSGAALVAREVVLGIVLGTIAVAVVLVTGIAVYGMQAPEDPAGVALWFAVGLVCFISIGVALGSVLPTSRSAAALGNLVFVPAFLLGGGGPPRAVMTGVMGTIADALPLSHVVGGLRLAWLGTTDDPHALWFPLLVTGLAVLVALDRARRESS